MYSGIILVAVLIAGVADATPNREAMQCFTKHLQNKGLLDSSSSKVELSSFCQDIMKMTENAIYDGISEKLQIKNSATDENECIIENLKSTRYTDYFLRGKVYESDNVASTNDLKKKITDNSKIHENINLRAIVRCTKGKTFNRVFNILYSGNSEKESDLENAYCTKKFVVDNNLVDPIYKFNLNPKNIDVTDIDCDTKITIIRKGSGGIINMLVSSDDEEVLGCAKQIYDANNFVEECIVVSVLEYLNLNDQQLAEFRNKYVDLMTKIDVESVKCSTI